MGHSDPFRLGLVLSRAMISMTSCVQSKGMCLLCKLDALCVAVYAPITLRLCLHLYVHHRMVHAYMSVCVSDSEADVIQNALAG